MTSLYNRHFLTIKTGERLVGKWTPHARFTVISCDIHMVDISAESGERFSVPTKHLLDCFTLAAPKDGRLGGPVVEGGSDDAE